MVARVGDIGAFQSSRHFAAWLGSVPRQHSAQSFDLNMRNDVHKSACLTLTNFGRFCPMWLAGGLGMLTATIHADFAPERVTACPEACSGRYWEAGPEGYEKDWQAFMGGNLDQMFA